VQSDEQLMAAYAKGDRAAFEELFRRYAPRLLATLSRGLARPEDGKDLTQQVFLQLHRHRLDYDSTRPFRPWLYTIAFNLKRRYVRDLQRRPETELKDSLLALLGMESPAHARYEFRELLLHALGQLAPETQELIALHWFGGLPLSEVAQLVGASESAVKVRAHRAYLTLQRACQIEAARPLEQADTAADAATGHKPEPVR
jgi:RNA polymerase sigma-70 factor (ECF subfamily)